MENEDLGPLSTKPRKVSLNFRCRRIFNPQTLAWTLYVPSVPTLPAIN